MKNMFLLLAAVIGFSSIAEAQYYGCFTTDFRTCSSAEIYCSASNLQNYNDFGPSVSFLCEDYNEAWATADTWLSQRDECRNLANACVAQYQECRSNYDALLAVANSNYEALQKCGSDVTQFGTSVSALNKRIAKMKRVCGKRCKKL